MQRWVKKRHFLKHRYFWEMKVQCGSVLFGSVRWRYWDKFGGNTLFQLNLTNEALNLISSLRKLNNIHVLLICVAQFLCCNSIFLCVSINMQISALKLIWIFFLALYNITIMNGLNWIQIILVDCRFFFSNKI